MPTPKGKGLTGSADGGTPGWQERTRARVNASQAEAMRRNKKKRPAQTLLETELAFVTMMRQAADSRGMTSAAYARRAVAAFISHDLGVPFEEVTKHCAAPLPVGAMIHPDNPDGIHRKSGKTVDNGQGFGDWTVG